MVDFSISLLPLIVLSVCNFILSWLWYSPVLFAKPWMKALGHGENREITENERRQMPFLFLSGIISSVLMVYGMMIVVHSLGIASFGMGILAGVVIWVGFCLTHSLNTLWEGRKPVVLLINNGLFLLTYAAFGGILAVWR
jgi:hypothetical protein